MVAFLFRLEIFRELVLDVGYYQGLFCCVLALVRRSKHGLSRLGINRSSNVEDRLIDSNLNFLIAHFDLIDGGYILLEAVAFD